MTKTIINVRVNNRINAIAEINSAIAVAIFLFSIKQDRPGKRPVELLRYCNFVFCAHSLLPLFLPLRHQDFYLIFNNPRINPVAKHRLVSRHFAGLCPPNLAFSGQLPITRTGTQACPYKRFCAIFAGQTIWQVINIPYKIRMSSKI
jgi:hypothetical protein